MASMDMSRQRKKERAITCMQIQMKKTCYSTNQSEYSYSPLSWDRGREKRESDKERIHLISPITKQCQLTTNASNGQKGREYRSVGGGRLWEIGKPET